ncbi:hypothetical protein [Intrasporangium flavum]|uniref:hypothetical protein n=1 Tax=Intrasporangium flavum TaxID=1428657 RepID=UPI0009700C0F|nr:hypothetical protein [Intrasporangium flavum]
MSTDATTPVPVAPGRSALPQFDATREVPTADVTREIPAQGSADTATLPAAPAQPSPIAPPQVPYTYTAAHPAPEDRTGAAAPVVPPRPATSDGPRWSAKKTAVTAGLAIVLASAGAIGAAAAMPAGSTGGDTGRFGRGFGPGGQNGQNGFTPFGRGNQGFGNQNGQGNLQNQLPGLNGLGNQNGQQGGPGLTNQGGQLPNLNGIDPNQLSRLDPQDLLKQLDQLTGGSDDGSSSTT